jgi:hypothetical protein
LLRRRPMGVPLIRGLTVAGCVMGSITRTSAPLNSRWPWALCGVLIGLLLSAIRRRGMFVWLRSGGSVPLGSPMIIEFVGADWDGRCESYGGAELPPYFECRPRSDIRTGEKSDAFSLMYRRAGERRVPLGRFAFGGSVVTRYEFVGVRV